MSDSSAKKRRLATKTEDEPELPPDDSFRRLMCGDLGLCFIIENILAHCVIEIVVIGEMSFTINLGRSEPNDALGAILKTPIDPRSPLSAHSKFLSIVRVTVGEECGASMDSFPSQTRMIAAETRRHVRELGRLVSETFVPFSSCSSLGLLFGYDGVSAQVSGVPRKIFFLYPRIGVFQDLDTGPLCFSCRGCNDLVGRVTSSREVSLAEIVSQQIAIQQARHLATDCLCLVTGKGILPNLKTFAFVNDVLGRGPVPQEWPHGSVSRLEMILNPNAPSIMALPWTGEELKITSVVFGPEYARLCENFPPDLGRSVLHENLKVLHLSHVNVFLAFPKMPNLDWLHLTAVTFDTLLELPGDDGTPGEFNPFEGMSSKLMVAKFEDMESLNFLPADFEKLQAFTVEKRNAETYLLVTANQVFSSERTPSLQSLEIIGVRCPLSFSRTSPICSGSRSSSKEARNKNNKSKKRNKSSSLVLL